jgi:hypothetical protein
MAELDIKLAEAEHLHRTMCESARRPEDDGGRDIVRLRARFAAVVVDILDAMKRDLRLSANPDRSAEFFNLLSEMRQKHLAHQSAWRGAAMASDPMGYRRASEDLIRNQDQFYVLARALLARN